MRDALNIYEHEKETEVKNESEQKNVVRKLMGIWIQIDKIKQ